MLKHYACIIDQDYKIGEIDPHLYSTFIEHAGRVIYGGIYDPSHETADDQGFRQDVIDAVKELKIPAVRYPGGNFVSNFDWKDSIGPRKSRPARLELAYLAIEDNEVGLDEYVDWARKTETEPMYTVNLGNPDCARDAGFLMEYCNFPGGTYWSDQRIKNGHKEPHNIKLWCLGNEMDGPWQLNAQTAYHYGLRACETAKIMKWTDPDSKLAAVGNSTAETKFPDWTREMLEQCYNHVDYVSIHRYYPLLKDFDDHDPDIIRYMGMGIEMQNYIRVISSTIDYVKAKLRSKHDVYISFDEYAPSAGTPHWVSLAETDGCPRTETPFIKGSPVFENHPPKTLLDALALGSMMCALLNSSDKVRMACQSMLMTSMLKAAAGKPLVKQTFFYPFQHASLYGRGEALGTVVKADHHKTNLITWSLKEEVEIPVIQSAAAFQRETGELNVFLLNADPDDVLLELDLRAFPSMELYEHIVLDGALQANNTWEHPERVVPRKANNKMGPFSKAEILLTKQSWNVLRFREMKS